MTLDIVGAARLVLDSSFRAIVAAAAVALILRVMRIRAAAVLHSAWTAVLFTMLLMPSLLTVVPALPIPLPSSAGGLLNAPRRSEDLLSAVVVEPSRERDAINPVRSARTSGSVPVVDELRTPTRTRNAQRWVALVLVGVYVLGVIVSFTRLVYGWCVASAMIRRAIRRGPVCVNDGRRVYQSSEVTIPMTVGVIRPVIILPLAWKTWESDTLAAIIAHESAHVTRRDATISFAAHLNRAIFWFHPLAWWLERKLAVTAEHACDEAAARAIAAPRRYAAILLEMADVVRREGGRIGWQSVGVNGAGLLNNRIDRLLRGDPFASVSRGKKIATAAACLVAIATVIACRQQMSAAPLREDPDLATRLAYRHEQTKRFEAARDMTQPQADELEQRIARNPEDFDARWRLVTYYRTSSRVAWDKKVPGLRRHALWLIEHHPEHEVEAPALSPRFDPEGFAASKKLWETHLAKPDVSPFLLYRAAHFFGPHDKPYAEQLILRGMAMDPDSAALKARLPSDVGGYQWPIQLSSLYAAALRGSESGWGTDTDLRMHLENVRSPYAIEVRRKLDATTDARLLARVGEHLTRMGPPAKDPALEQAVDQVRALGVTYLQRALELDPKLVTAKAVLVRMRLAERATDVDRLASRSLEEYMRAEDITEYFKKDPGAAKQQREEAKARAEEVLKITAMHAQDPAYSAAAMIAHHVLATAALRDGDRERAVYHMRESVKVPTSEQIQYAPPFSWLRPVNRLLKEGERDRVAEFLEAFASLTLIERARLLEDARAIREGRMTPSYQSMVAHEGQ